MKFKHFVTFDKFVTFDHIEQIDRRKWKDLRRQLKKKNCDFSIQFQQHLSKFLFLLELIPLLTLPIFLGIEFGTNILRTVHVSS